MARDLTTGFIDEIDAPRTIVFNLVEADFPSGWVGMFSGYGSLVYDGKTFLGGGKLLAFSDAEEAQGFEAVGNSVTLSGLDTELVAIALLEEWQGTPITRYMGVKNEDTGDIFVTPLYKGRIDGMSISDDGETSTITISVEDYNYILQKAVGAYYTDADQRGRFPNDKGLGQIARIEDLELTWGQT